MRLTLRWLSVVAAASCWFSARLCCMVGSVSRQYFISTTSASPRLMGLLFFPSSYHEYVWSVLVPCAFLFHNGLSSPSLCVHPCWDSGGERPTGSDVGACCINAASAAWPMSCMTTSYPLPPFEPGFQQCTPSYVVAYGMITHVTMSHTSIQAFHIILNGTCS
jgi:hypothetical protein